MGMDLPDICQFSYYTAFYRPFNSRKSSQNTPKGTPPLVVAVVTNISYAPALDGLLLSGFLIFLSHFQPVNTI